MKRQTITGNLAKEQLLEGAKILYEAVSTTLGPKGQNAVIEAYGEPIVTHDGVTVAKSIEDIEDCSPGARVGIEMIKASSSKTNDNVGDGTTSSTILTYHLMKQGVSKIKEGKNAMVLRRELQEAADAVLADLEQLAQPVTSLEDCVDVATISSEDPIIGKEVGSMYHKLGKDGMVVVEMGTKPWIEYEIVEGYNFDRGLYSPLLVRDTRTQTTTAHKPGVLIAHQTIDTEDVALLVGQAYNKGIDQLLIIANEFKPSFIDDLATDENIQVICVKAPGFGDNRIELLRDLAAFTGTEVVGDRLPKKIKDLLPVDLGTCDEVVSSLNDTVITGGKNVEEYIKGLEAQAEKLKGLYEKDKIAKRIAQLRGQVGVIRVGGNTEMEAEERKMLIDDAVAATDAALKDGIVPGGGTTYLQLAERLTSDTDGAKLLKNALSAPFEVLMTNSGERWGKKLEELTTNPGWFGRGFDVMGGEDVVDLKEHGIIDPVLVIRQAVTNATSVACSALTAGVLIVKGNEKESKYEKE